jgi:hypothetical protein
VDAGFGCGSCLANVYTECDSAGNKTGEIDCAEKVCITNKGCLDCAPGKTTCVGNDVHGCTEEGKPGELVSTCDVSAGEICNAGECKSECEIVQGAPSNVGCEFWAVDLPNERGLNDAAAQPWGVVLSNAGVGTAQVTIESNQAAPGQPLDLVVVHLDLASGHSRHRLARRSDRADQHRRSASPPGSFLSSGIRIVHGAARRLQFNNFLQFLNGLIH